MRKHKPDNLKVRSITLTTPFPQVRLPEGSSAAYNAMLAERILGTPFAAFVERYGNPVNDLRFKRDPISQEFIRCARWMVESKILGLTIGASSLFLNVQWLKTGVTNWVRFDFRDLSRGFRHVIYDEALEEPMGGSLFKPCQFLNQIGVSLKLDRRKFRGQMLYRWLMFSLGRAAELGCEVE